MSNNLSKEGAQPQKQTRFATLYNGRWSGGLWTNRSPLRDAATNRLVEQFYGPARDALIGGSNVEITNRLTLARRPGNPVYDSNSYTSVDSIESFRVFGPTTEQIYVMIDQANALYSLFNGTKTLVWTKSAGGGQSYMQSVGNSLYFANGVDNKKWLQTLTTWSASATYTASQILSTWFIDSNGNIQQLTTAGTSGGSQPVWSTTVPSSANNFQGGITTDNTAHWTNRGKPAMNWGISQTAAALTPTIGSSRSAWAANTYYSIAGAIIDSNGNLQQVTVAGKSAGSAPTWATGLNATTTDGTVTWTLIRTAGSGATGLTWTAHTLYTPGAFILGNAGGTSCLFEAATQSLPNISGSITAAIYNSPHTGAVGAVTQTFPAGAALNTATGTSFLWNTGTDVSAQPGKWETVNAAGEVTGSTTPFSQTTDYMIAFTGTLNVPKAGQYTFAITHQDGILFGIGGAATKVSGPSIDALSHTQTVVQGYTLMGANNQAGSSTDTIVVNFPAAGSYGIELDYDFWYHSGNTLNLTCNGKNLPFGTPISGTTQPIWPSWISSYAPNYPSVADGALTWNNIGPATDFVWAANINFTLPNTTIIDPNSNQEAPYRSGVTGTARPSFATLLNQLTNDNPNLTWINQGAASAPTPGTVSTFNGGWSYCVALVNTLDDTVSNASPLSAPTGSFIGATGVTLAAGAGLPAPANIDPQSDYVAVFRTTDGAATPFLIPGSNIEISGTLPLATYLASGYTDTTPDTGLNNLIEAPIAAENTPPGAGAVNLTYHLGRIFFSIGNTVYWTSGPDTPIGNGDGVAPLNFSEVYAQVKRLVPTSQGVMVFTVSDVFSIGGLGTASNPIQKALPYIPGVGLLSYNALAQNGALIGFFTSDSQFVTFDPSSGVSYVGFPIGDQLRKNSGAAGTTWNPSNVYVTWHVNGEDQAWYVSDGQFGWYRLMPTPAPETGLTWSPFATIIGGCKAVQSVEVTPGVHKLLLGPTGTGNILKRDLESFQDNGQSYPAWAIVGSTVLVQPGQIATVSFITTESINTGTPLILGVLMDEAYPYYTQPFDLLKRWVPDPPNLPKSKSLLAQRFYLSELDDEAAVCRHMQIQVNWVSENVQNELLSLSVFGAFMQEE